MMAVGGEPADLRTRRRQQAQFRPRQVACANEQHRTGSQVEKHRQESHARLASPTCGVDWNYFLYMSHSTPAKRKLFLLYRNATIEFSPPKAKAHRCIFSTTTKQKTGFTERSRSRRLQHRTFPLTGASPRPAWITSTRWKPRASKFSGKPSRG